MNNQPSILLVGNLTRTRLLLKAAFGQNVSITQSDSIKTFAKKELMAFGSIVLNNESPEIIKRATRKLLSRKLPVQLVSELYMSGEISEGVTSVLSNGRDLIKNIRIDIASGFQASKNLKPAKHVSLAPMIALKRCIDVAVSGTLLLLLSPLFLLVMLLIRLEDKGPAFYGSSRVGQGYKVFKLYKFRSMYTNADARLKEIDNLDVYSQESKEASATDCQECQRLQQPCSNVLIADGRQICEKQYIAEEKAKTGGIFKKFKNDPRVTKVGAFIRNTSIDELPQLLNVLKGDMSLVGNRPLPLYEAENLTSDQAITRFMAPAGLTGLWQVTQRGKKVSKDERIALDNEYTQRFSLWLDLKIMLRTFPALLQQENV